MWINRKLLNVACRIIKIQSFRPSVQPNPPFPLASHQVSPAKRYSPIIRWSIVYDLNLSDRLAPTVASRTPLHSYSNKSKQPITLLRLVKNCLTYTLSFSKLWVNQFYNLAGTLKFRMWILESEPKIIKKLHFGKQKKKVIHRTINSDVSSLIISHSNFEFNYFLRFCSP